LDYSFLGVGGTSASSPAFAGIMALVNQKTGSRQGNANYTLYALAKKTGASCAANGATLPAPTCIFNDVAKSNNSVPCAGKSTNCSSATTAVGILVNPAGSPAYAAMAGYDLATGLGSVNVTNLVNNWSTVSTVSTSTTLTVNNGSASAINHGSSVPVSITVAPSSGTATPTGDVALVATYSNGNSVGLGDFKLAANGTITASTTSLTGGSYRISAHYTGDGTFAPSDSTQHDVTVNPESSKVLISVPTFNPQTGAETSNNPISLVYGSPYIARIDVGNAAATLNFPQSRVCRPPSCPTGTITLTDSLNGASAVPLDAGTFALNSYGFAEDLPIQLPGGSHVITANYSGDSSFSASSATYQLTVTPAPTSLIPGNPPLPPQITEPFGIGSTLTTTSTGVMPSCNLTYFEGTTPVAGTLNCSGQNGSAGGYAFLQPALIVSTATAGTHTYTIKFTGDSNYAPSNSLTTTTQVFYGTTFTLTPSVTTVQFGSPVTLIAVVDTFISQGPPLSNAVSFNGNNGNPSFGSVTYAPIKDSSGNIALQASVTFSPQESSFYFASFAGDSNYGSSGGNTFVNVNIPDFSLSAPANPIAITSGQSAALNVSVTPASNASSPVAMSCPQGYLPINVTCSFAPPTVNLSGGTAVTTVLTLNSLPASASNSVGSAPLEFDPPGPDLPPPPIWYSIAVAAVMAILLRFVLRPLRSRRFTRLAGFGFTFCLFAAILGCGGGSGASFGGGGGGSSQPAPSSITLTVDNLKVAYPASINLTAKVTSTKTPGGTVTFLVDGPSGFGNVAVVNGVAQVQIPVPQVGTHIFRASYTGDANTQPSQTAGSLNVVVTGNGVGVILGTTGNLAHTTNIQLTIQ